MLSQLLSLQEGLAAVRAHEEVLVHVCADVRDEVGAPVRDEHGAQDRAFATVGGADVRQLPTMDALAVDE
ncbi:hypothetical protein HispidOSU_027985, partial [Sigmodon hispidus]